MTFLAPQSRLSRTPIGRAPTTGMVVAALCASVVLAGCTRSTNLNQGGLLPTQQRPATPLTPTPLTPVNQAQLDPVSGGPTPPTPSQVTPVETPVPEPEKPVEVAKVEPPKDSKPLTKEALVGAWTVSTGGSNCQIFLALTKWSGGFRAASRGCSAQAISDVQAWDVKGSQVVLVNSAGSNAATLFKSNDSRYDGSTTSGGAISFSR